MLSTIRTIFTFNKNLTLDLPSALTWVFLYNHEGPCGAVLCSLEMMIIKKHLLSDFSSIWLSLPLWSLSRPGCSTGLSIFFSTSSLNSSVLVKLSMQQSSFYLLLCWTSWGLFMGERSNTAHYSVSYSVDLLAGCASYWLSFASAFLCCKVMDSNTCLWSIGWGFNWVTLVIITIKDMSKVGNNEE